VTGRMTSGVLGRLLHEALVAASAVISADPGPNLNSESYKSAFFPYVGVRGKRSL